MNFCFDKYICKCSILLCLLSFVLLFSPGICMCADSGGAAVIDSGRVERVEAVINCEGYVLPAAVQTRIAGTVRVVAEKIIVGCKIDEMQTKKAQDELLLKEVFNRALVGYLVDNVRIIPAENTQIVVELHLLGDIVKTVNVVCNFHGVDQEFVPLFSDNMVKIKKKVEDILLYLPIDAVDWAGNLIKLAIQEYFALELPDYRASVDVAVEEQSVKITVEAIPLGVQIRSTQIKLKTQSFPNTMLYDFRTQLEDISQKLNGLPVSFVVSKKAFYDNWLFEKAINNSIAQKWGLFVKVDVEPAVDTMVLIDTKAEKYNVYAEGYFDFGKDKDNISGKAHVGHYWSGRDEGFLEAQFVPSTLKWHFLAGVAHRIDKSTYFAVKYDFTREGTVLWLHQDLSKRWKFEMDRFLPTGFNEFRLRYMLHDYGALEYVVNRDENFLRFVAIF